jgi:hypothetical protein
MQQGFFEYIFPHNYCFLKIVKRQYNNVAEQSSAPICPSQH